VLCACSADEIPILQLSGYDLTCEYLEQNGFDVPIIVDRPDGLDLHVPPPTFTVHDVENYVGQCTTLHHHSDYAKCGFSEWTTLV